tara:strand:+ start:783 stop:1166 length:384 start_codon:yes stop_codon:yes gene_type:complete
MKKLLIFLILSLPVIFVGCDDPKPILVREWPHLETIEVTGNSTSGFTLHAAITSEGNSEIIRYGFFISRSRTLTIGNGDFVFSDNRANNEFSAQITDYLVSGEKYYLRAYAEIQDHNVYAEALEFEY